MKNKQLIILAVLAFTIMSFNGNRSSDESSLYTGTYGVCGDDIESATKIELIINEDFTFHYINNSDPKRPINIKGNWKLIGNTIMLMNYQSDVPIHNKWKIDKNHDCLKSRKGINFTRLCDC